MNDRYSVEILIPRHETIQPDVTQIWVQSGSYQTLDEAQGWATHQMNQKRVLAARIRHHQWSSDLVWEQSKADAIEV